MKALMILGAGLLAMFLGNYAKAADVAGKYVMKTQEATSEMTVSPVENNKYRVVIDAKTPLLNDEHTMHASLLEGVGSLGANSMDVSFRATGDDPSDMRDPEKSYSVVIEFSGKQAVVKETAGHRDAILNTPFGSVDIQGTYVKDDGVQTVNLP